MPHITIPGRDDAPSEARSILDNVDSMLGFVPNLQRLMSISPNALAGWAGLMGSLSKTLDVKTRDGVALAVSEADCCDYCLAKALIDQRGKVSEQEFALVKEAGCTDADIVEMIGLRAQFLLTNFMNDVVRTPIDFPEVVPVTA